MNTNNCAARHVKGLFDWNDEGTHHIVPQRGDFDYEPHDGFVLCCPGCGNVSLLPLGISEGNKPGGVHRWQLSGTHNKPTLHPSINHVGCWHGWLKDGQFTSC